MRHFFSIMDEGIRVNKVTLSLQLPFQTYLSSIFSPSENPNILIANYPDANLFPEFSLDHEPIYLIQSQIQQDYNKIHLPPSSPCLETLYLLPTHLYLCHFPLPPMVPAFSQLSMKTQDLPLLFLLPDLLFYINSIHQILLIFQ